MYSACDYILSEVQSVFKNIKINSYRMKFDPNLARWEEVPTG